jgi:predicted permease
MVRGTILGDLQEAYAEKVRVSGSGRAGLRKADRWYWWQALTIGSRYSLKRTAPALRGGRPFIPESEPLTRKPRFGAMKDIVKDIRFALRLFVRNPGYTAASVMVLAIGIGAVTLMYSTLNSAVLRPLPFEDPDQLVWVWSANDVRNSNSTSALDYWDYREQTEALQSMAAILVFTPRAIITGGEEPERVSSTLASHNLFSTLGVAPQLGRSFLLEEERNGDQNVVVISDGFWQRRLGSSREVIGSSVTINGEPYQVVGVMPVGFDYPNGVELWFPMQARNQYTQSRGNNNFNMLGRLADGISIEQAYAELNTIARRLERQYPETNEAWRVRVVSLHERYFAGTRSTLLIMFGLVGLVLLVACANVASLALARATARGTEMAVRFSLGALRTRLVRQLMTESVIVALAGGAVGLLLARLGISALKSMGPGNLPRLDQITIDGSVLLFAFVLSLMTSLLFGVVPAFKGTGLGLADTLKAGGARGFSQAKSRFRSALVVAQVSLSLMLLIASGLLIRSYSQLNEVDPGFPEEGILGAELQLPDWKYESPEESGQTWELLYDRVGALPGVISVGSIDQPPIRSGGTYNTIYRTDNPPASAAERAEMSGQRRIASAGYFETMGIPLLSGRVFDRNDRVGTPNVVVISATMAEYFFPNEDPLGHDLFVWGMNYQVIGVVGDVKEFGLEADFPRVFYMSGDQFPRIQSNLFVRAAGNPLELAPALRRAIWEVERDIPISGLEVMESRLSRSLAQPRFRMVLVALFGVVALILAAMGLYGVLAYFVRQRARELGIRIAMGARPGNVMGLVVAKGMTLVGLGILVGLAGGFAGGRVLDSLLFDVSATDALTYGAVSLFLVVVALLACMVPALRALRVDPQEVLRVE